jgi:predicted MFS family arabinose efflux permease
MSVAFFVCGLQLVFLTTHLPTYLAQCGMDASYSALVLMLIGGFNVLSSWLFGWLGDRYPKRLLLGGIYLLRSATLAAFFMHPPTPLSVVLFGAAMGTLWLGVIPLVNGLVVQIFGLRFLSTLTGIAFLSHQAGSFLGAWGGGYLFDLMGSYDLAWKIGVIVGLVAGTMQLLMNDRPTERVLAAEAAAD